MIVRSIVDTTVIMCVGVTLLAFKECDVSGLVYFDLRYRLIPESDMPRPDNNLYPR